MIELLPRLLEIGSGLKEIHLDLNPFFEHFSRYSDWDRQDYNEYGFDELMEGTGSTYLKLLQTIKSSTKNRPLKIHFQNLRHLPVSSHECIADLLIQSCRILDGSNSDLRGFHFIGPFLCGVTSQGFDDKGSKTFSTVESSDFVLSYNTVNCTKFLREVVEFTGGKLNKLKLDLLRFQDLENGKENDSPSSRLLGLYEELEKSKDFLIEIDLSLNRTSHQLLDLVASCSNLSSLTLLLKDLESISPVYLPPFLLKKFKLEIDSRSNKLSEMDWLINWCGARLEYLDLNLNCNSLTSQLRGTILYLVLRFNQSLKDLKLKNLSIDSSSNNLTLGKESLPSLESLTIHGVNSSVFAVLSFFTLPKLQELFTIASPKRQPIVDKEEGDLTSQRLLEVLKSCSSLVRWESDCREVGCYHGSSLDTSQLVKLAEDQRVTLPGLETLKIHHRNTSWFKFSSQILLPQLKLLDIFGASVQPESFFEFLNRSATSVEQVKLRQVKVKDVSEFKSNSLEKLQLPKIRFLYLNCAVQLMEIFANAEMESLETLSVFLDPEKQPDQEPIIIYQLLQSTASTLVKLDLSEISDSSSRQYSQTQIHDRSQIEFPNLLDLRFGLCSSPMCNFLLKNCNFPKMLKAELKSSNLPFELLVKFIARHSSKLESLETSASNRTHDLNEELKSIEDQNPIMFPNLSYLSCGQEIMPLFDYFIKDEPEGFEGLKDEEKVVTDYYRKEISEIAPKLDTSKLYVCYFPDPESDPGSESGKDEE